MSTIQQNMDRVTIRTQMLLQILKEAAYLVQQGRFSPLYIGYLDEAIRSCAQFVSIHTNMARCNLEWALDFVVRRALTRTFDEVRFAWFEAEIGLVKPPFMPLPGCPWFDPNWIKAYYPTPTCPSRREELVRRSERALYTGRPVDVSTELEGMWLSERDNFR